MEYVINLNKQMAVFQEVALLEVSKLNDSKQRTRRSNPVFSRKKALEKNEVIITPIDGSCYKIVNSSVLQEIFFICLKTFIMQWKKETVEIK